MLGSVVLIGLLGLAQESGKPDAKPPVGDVKPDASPKPTADTKPVRPKPIPEPKAAADSKATSASAKTTAGKLPPSPPPPPKRNVHVADPKRAADPAADPKASSDSTTSSPTDATSDGGPAPKPVHVLNVPTPRPKAADVPSYKVAVRLPNGRRFSGVVSRDKAFHELVYAGAHHYGDVYQRDDRFTLRFVDGLDGDLELGWNEIVKLEVREVLDSAGVRAMEEAYTSARIARQVEAEKDDAPATTSDDPNATPPSDGARPATKDDAAKPPAAGETKQDEGKKDDATKDGSKTDSATKNDVAKGDAKKSATPLLDEFPPSEGWTPDRKKQIEWRRTVVGLFPDAREARFLEVYDQWALAFEQWAAEQAKSQKTNEKGEKNDKSERGDKSRAESKNAKGERDPVREKDATKAAREPAKDPAKDVAPKDPPKPKDAKEPAKDGSDSSS